MDLKLYNTLTKTKEVFQPLRPENVRMYVCGPTVYDYAHIGNARPAIVFDVLFRLLRHKYGESHVTYVRNITDVDDKINARAAEIARDRGIPIEHARAEVTAQTEKQYQDDVAALGCLPPTHEPRATAHVPQMIAMIEHLIAAGHAYAAEGHVLYDVTSKPDYGKLARRSLEEMLAGARVDVAPYKKGPMDFVLWKPSGPDLPGWDSPWGRGRPGWHIECSAMSEALLGETFDIHGGGIDLVFPHHENEIAQSEGAHAGHPFARVWMHNGFLQVEGQKMSKSLGNFVTIRQLLERWNDVGWSGDALRCCMLRTHYRQPIDWTLRALEESNKTLRALCDGLEKVSPGNVPPETLDALFDDLNVPLAMSRLHDLKNEARQSELLASLHLLGFSGDPMKVVRRIFVTAAGVAGGKATVSAVAVSEIAIPEEFRLETERLIVARSAARKAKDFKEADRIRAELDAMGVQLKDSKDPATGEIVTTWELKR